MIKLITILMLCVSAVWSATFTDVTIEGTPYLSTSVMHELYISAILRNGSVFSATTGVVLGSQYLNEIGIGYPINLRSYWHETNTIPLIIGIRTMVSFDWDDWWPTVPTNAFALPDYYDTINEFFHGAGLSSNGYRRAYSYDPTTNNWRNVDDPMYTYTTAPQLSTGEILGPWIIDDLQRVLNHMQYYVRSSASWTGIGATNTAGSYGFSQVGWEEAKESYTAWVPGTSSGFTPRKWSIGNIDTSPDPDRWYATQRVYINTLRSSTISSNSPLHIYGGTMHFAAYSTAYASGSGDVFDAFGTVLEQDNYIIFDDTVIAPATTGFILSDVLGDLSQPAWCSPPAIGVPSSRGYKVTAGRIFTTIPFPYTRD